MTRTFLMALKHRVKYISFIILLIGVCNCYNTAYSSENELSIISQSRNFSVFANETVQLPCLIKKQTPSTVVIWNQCEDPACHQVRNPLTINKDNFIQDLRFRVLFENLQDSIQNSEVKENDDVRHIRSRFRYRDAENTDSYGDINKWTLEIRKFSKKDEGCYQCQLNSFDTKTISYCINLQKKVYATPKKMMISVDEKIHIKCSTDENVRMSSIKWYRNGHRVIPNSHVKISKHSANDFMHSHLTINHATLKDAGTYSCKFDHIHARVHVDVVESHVKKQLAQSSLSPKSNTERSNPDDDSYFDSYKFFSKSSAQKHQFSNFLVLLLSCFLYLIGSF